MTQEKKTGTFEIRYSGRISPVDVYSNGQQHRFRITFGDASEIHAFWNGRQWSGRGLDVIEPFIPLLQNGYPQLFSPNLL